MKKLLVAASLMIGFASPAYAVTGFRSIAIDATEEGADVTLMFFSRGKSNEGHGHTINLSLATSLGKVIPMRVAPTSDGPVKLSLSYKALGLQPGAQITNISGVWQGNNHQWGANAGRPSGGPLTLPALKPPPPPPIATASIFAARAATLGVKKGPTVTIESAPAPAKVARAPKPKVEPVVQAAMQAPPPVAAPTPIAAPTSSVAHAQLAAMARMKANLGRAPVQVAARGGKR